MAKTKATLVKQINASKARIAKERDKLRDLISDVEQLADDCDEAVDDLTRGAEALSRLV